MLVPNLRSQYDERCMSAEFFPDFRTQTFFERLREQRTGSESTAPDWRQWLQYWDDEESPAGNLRNFEHWLQRAPPRLL